MTYDKLRAFFSGYDAPSEFYGGIQQYVCDAGITSPGDINIIEMPVLSVIINTIVDYNATSYCRQQALLLAAGIKAMFSHYNAEMEAFVLVDGCGDLKLEFWRSFDLRPPILPYRSHLQLVIDEWNGTKIFEINNITADKIEVEMQESEFRTWDERNDCLLYPLFPAKLNSILCTTKNYVSEHTYS